MDNITQKLRAFFKGKRVVILGFGREGKSTLEILKDCEPEKIIIADRCEISPDDSYTVCTGENYLSCLDDCDIIMKAPGIGLKNDVGDDIKAKITSQMDLFLRYAPGTVVGVTGTKGKSTTSSLIYHFARACGKDAFLIGNIGVPPLEKIAEFTQNSLIVCEMSCHQLEYVKASPHIAVLLNVYPEHLDHYVDFNAYKNAKLNIFKYQTEKDSLISAYELSPDINTRAKVIYAGFGEGDIGTKNGGIYLYDTVIPGDDIVSNLKGEHNLYNIAIALKAAELSGCDIKASLLSLKDFIPLEHRLELFGTYEGVQYINDSISTAPQTSIAALKAYPGTDTLIVGGMDRGISYDELTEYLNKGTSVKNLIILPDSGKRVAQGIVNKEINILYADNMEMAVALAKEHTRVRCILSPAAASYGFYKNFEERGRHFKTLVDEIYKK